MLNIYNSLARRKEPFNPIDPDNVRMYVCGMTVYDYCHLGHARVLVVFDIVYRYLCQIYGENHVKYARNVTDVDDKIIKRANEKGEDMGSLTDRFIEAMHEDAHALGVLPPNEEPRATEHIEHILEMIQALVANGYAYNAGNNDVYYDISRFDNYGQLSGKQVDDLRAGARVEVSEAKDDPLDFVLWKAAKPDEPSWDSPWGPGRPGWHIECSAMSTHCLGNHFDIHGGGQDLQFPHHENEIAQSQGATGEKFVNVWMHNGFVRVDEEKMSKSLDNFFTIREILKNYDPEVVRFFILNSHYRSPLNYSDQQLDGARAALGRLYTSLRGLTDKAADGKTPKELVAYEQRFYAAMDDDFNTPEALAIIFELAHGINRERDQGLSVAQAKADLLRRLARVLGILERSPEDFLQASSSPEGGLAKDEIETLIQQRIQARELKDWTEADRIRDLLQDKGVVLEDASGATTWRRE